MSDAPDHGNNLRFELIADKSEQIAEDPLQFVRRKLRGRYRLTILLALLLALCGSLIGYSAAPVKYESTGLIQFKPVLPTILYKSVENQPTPLYDSFVSAQATLIRNSNVIEEALKDTSLASWDIPLGPEGVERIRGMISVHHRRGDQIVRVTATHRDPQFAHATVNAVLKAYNRNYHETIRLSPSERERKLKQRVSLLKKDLLVVGETILEISDQYGVDTIKRLHNEKIQALIATDQKLAELNLALTTLEVQSERRAAGLHIDNAREFDSFAGAFISSNTDSIGGLQKEERAIMAEMKSFEGKFGRKHPRMRTLERKLKMARIQISLFEQANGVNTPFNVDQGNPEPSVLAQASMDRIREIESQYQKLRDRLRVEATELGSRSITLSNLQEQETTIKMRLKDTEKALDVIRVESDREESARILIASLGDLPTVPTTDRRFSLAFAAGLFGVGMAVCLVVVIGIFDPRCRFAQELQAIDESAQVISLIPDISVNCAEIDQLAALGVHQLRNLLELQQDEPSQIVFTITSPGRSEGKTSLVLALGASFAIAGRKTLIIDADLTHAGLTRDLDMEKLPGLWEAINSNCNDGEIHQTDNDNLWALPVGDSVNSDPRDIARDKLLKLLEAVRSRFDVIIFDTGPVMTSLEASLVSSISDRVIMTVARNQHTEQVRASLERLRRIGSECKGLVFNLAPPSDFDRRDWHVAQTPAQAAPLIPDTPAHDRNLVGTIGKINGIRARSESLRNAA
ncbi:MAG: AAA family ATPase [Planctomycetes bacterium]|nr:AAA family ATPase [Planctomycetota bacterium]